MPSTAVARGLLDQCVAILTDVSTGGRKIEFAQAEYQRLHQNLGLALGAHGLSNPIPWARLSGWRGHWKAHFPTYEERRTYIRTLVDDTYAALDRIELGAQVDDPLANQEETWAGLNDRIDGLRGKIANAATLDDWQDCGRRSREILVHLSRLMSQRLAPYATDDAPKAADGKAWMDVFLGQYVAGSSHKTLRQFYRSTWELSQSTTHANVDEVEAFASAQAVVLLVRTTERILQRTGNPPA